VSLSQMLTAGTYTVSIQQFNNFAGANLSDGYSADGAQYQNFRNGFVDAANNKRDSHWAFDILNVTEAEQLPPTSNVPEPASLAILSLGIVGIGALRRRRN
jgi:hypothetical protein